MKFFVWAHEGPRWRKHVFWSIVRSKKWYNTVQDRVMFTKDAGAKSAGMQTENTNRNTKIPKPRDSSR